MAIDDKLTDLMAARLSKGEDLDLIYTNPKNHVFVLFLPINPVVGTVRSVILWMDGKKWFICRCERLRESWRCRKG